MNKSELAGLGKVFSFTLRQHYKSKATVVTLVILFLLTAASVPLLSVFYGGGSADNLFVSSGESSALAAEHPALTEVCLENDTDLTVTGADIAAACPSFAGVVFRSAADAPNPAAPETAALVRITDDGNGGVTAAVSDYAGSSVSDSELNVLGQAAAAAVRSAAVAASGATEGQMAAVSAGYSVTTSDESALNSGDEESFGASYAVTYAYDMVIMMLCILSTSYIIRSVVEEKSTRLVELLMISVQPLALILGKILAVMVWMTIGVLLLLTGFGLSCLITAFIPGFASASTLAVSAGLGGILSQMSPAVVPLILISLLLGYTTFSLLGGFFASGCSSTEDMTGASLSATLLVLIGYMASLFQSISGIPAVNVTLSLLPILSVFCAPVNYVCGRIGLGLLCLSWVIQAGFIALLARLTAAVYRSLILYNGSRVKFFRLLRTARRARGGAVQ